MKRLLGPVQRGPFGGVSKTLLAVLAFILVLTMTSVMDWGKRESRCSVSVETTNKEPSKLLLEGVNPDELMIPLTDLQTAFHENRATVIVLRIMKTGSTGLQALFSTRNEDECSPHLDKELMRPEKLEQKCNRLFRLMVQADYDTSCEDMRGWDDPKWMQPDCIPFIAADEYLDRFFELPHEAQERMRTMFRGARIISGHIPYGVHRIGHRGTFAYVTQLREPIARVVSHINHWLVDHPEDLVDSTWDKRVLDPSFRHYTKSNHQTRFLCNEGNVGRYRVLPSMHFVTDDEEVTEAHYRCALSHLRKDFALVFVTEQVHQVYSLAPLVARIFNMKVQTQDLTSSVYNPTNFENGKVHLKPASNISEPVRQYLTRMNKWDILLYREAEILHKISIERLQNFKEGR